MVRMKTCPSGPRPNSPPPSPPVTDKPFEPLDEETLLKSIPESTVTFKAGPPPKKPRTAAVVTAAAIAEEAEEERRKDPVKGRRFGQQAQVPQSREGRPKPPFVRGQIGNIIYTSKPAQFLTAEMPDGCSLVVRSWRKAIPELEPHGKYIITDPFGGIWYAPDAFNEWRAGMDSGTFPELDLEVT